MGNERDEEVLVLSVGQRFEVMIHGEWCQVRLESGGYRGRYYVTATGERGRLALCMAARLCQQSHEGSVQQDMATMSLEQARAIWVGKQVKSLVPLACGVVRGVVREITQRGYVVFVYSPCLNEVAVMVSFPFERIGDVLEVRHAV